MAISPRPELAGLGPCPHGALGAAEREVLGGEVLDFSVNTNPLGPSPLVAPALATAEVARYPDTEATALRQSLAGRLGVATENIIVGNGSVEIIWLVAWAYLRPGDTVLIIGPTFGEYERASRIAGARVIAYGARAERGFQPDVAEVIGLIQKERPRLIFLCNPNNPTGVYLGREAVEHLAHASPDSLLIIDEAYVNFVEERWPSIPLIERGNVLVLRSMTKDYALTGLRLGYGLACSEIISALATVRPPWSVNALAQAAGLASLQDQAHLACSRQEVGRAKRYLMEEIAALGFRVFPAAANFFLVEVGNAPAFRSALLARGCSLRDGTSFGLPEFVRIGVQTLPECKRLIAAMKEIAPTWRRSHLARVSSPSPGRAPLGRSSVERG